MSERTPIHLSLAPQVRKPAPVREKLPSKETVREWVRDFWMDGLGTEEIQEIIGESGHAKSILNRLREKEEIPRRRAKRSTPDQLEALDFDVKRLRGKGLTASKIAEILGKPIYMVKDSIERMIDTQQIQSKALIQHPLSKTA